MAATRDLHPNLTASQLNTILAKAGTDMTVAELYKILDAVKRVPVPANRNMATLGSLFV